MFQINCNIESEKFVQLALKWIEDKQGKNTKTLDIRNQTTFADYFIITSGTSERQVSAIAQNIEYEAKKIGMEPKSVEGERESHWILLDYYDVIIHVFYEKDREFYDLERLWKEDLRPEKED